MSVARHTAYNFAGAVVPLAVSLVTVPFYLEAIGLDRYGILSICLLLVGYFRLFDLGIGRATAQKIATLAGASDEARSRVFWTGAAISSLLAVFAAVVFLPVARVSLSFIDIPPGGLAAEVASALPLLIAAVPFGLAQSLMIGSLEGRSEFLKISLINSFGSIATAVLPLLTAWYVGPELAYLILAVLASRTMLLALLIVACARTVPLRRAEIELRGEIVGLVKFGGWTTVTSVIGPLMVVFDRFAIGAVLGSAAVALYTIPFNLAWQITVLPAALASAMFPRFASSDLTQGEQLKTRTVEAMSIVMTPSVILVALCAPPLVALWLGEQSGAVAYPILCFLLFGLWINSFGRICFSRLQATGKPHRIAYLMLVEVVPYLGLLFLGMKYFGLLGAAAAWSLRCLVDTVALFRLDGTPIRRLDQLGTQGVIVLLAIAVSLILPVWTLYRALAAVVIVALAMALVWRAHPQMMIHIFRTLMNGVRSTAPDRG